MCQLMNRQCCAPIIYSTSATTSSTGAVTIASQSSNRCCLIASICASVSQRFDDWYAVVTAPTPEYQLDEFGNQVLDDNGNPIEVVSNG